MVSLVRSSPQRARSDSPAVGAADADAGDTRARQADGDVQVLNDDAKRRQDRRDGRAARGLDGVAALERAGRARARGLRRRGGDGKDCERGEGRGELGEHVGFERDDAEAGEAGAIG